LNFSNLLLVGSAYILEPTTVVPEH